MDPERWTDVRRLFEAALDVAPAEREAWLQRETAGDRALCEQVGELLRADAVAAGATPVDRVVLEHAVPGGLVGQRLGGFTIRRLLGVGGMGAVYEAEQERPHRRVALKTLGLGFSSERARLRFEDEAEILARLNHPGIARVLAAGTLRAHGLELPYFAMELVEAPRPLDRHVRDARCDARGIAALLQGVCEAVHYAHQRGVIHRDLKPQNILVDGTGASKIIDFGIAHVVGTDAVGRRTKTGEVLGTLAYMSPECLLGGLGAASTAGDVYALGVILYELLTGQLPLPVDELPPARAVEVLRRHRPRPPSTVAGRTVPVELDWITLRAMAAEPDRRYASAAQLAADLEAFLHGAPVLAGPPSAAYRLRKLARRHRLALAVAAFCCVALLIGAVTAAIGWRRAVVQAATLAEVNRFQRQILSAAYSDSKGRDVRLADLLDAAAGELDAASLTDADVEVGLRTAIGVSYLGLGLLDQAERQFARGETLVRERGLDAGGATAIALRNNLGVLYDERGQIEPAEQALRSSLCGKLALWGDDHEETAATRNNLASVLMKRGAYGEALDLATAALRTYGRRPGPSAEAITARTTVALALSALGRTDAADVAFQAAVQQGLELGSEHPATLAARSAWATHLRRCGRLREFLDVARDVAAVRARVLGETHPRTLMALNNLAVGCVDLGELAEAETTLRRIVDVRARAGAANGFDVISTRQNFASVVRRRGRFAEAEADLRALYADAVRALPAEHWLTAVIGKELGTCLRQQGRFAEAEPLLLTAAAQIEKALGSEDPRTQRAFAELQALYEAQQQPQAAAVWAARRNGQ